MRSKLSNEIFHDEMLSLYQQKDLSYQQVRDTAIEAMGRLIRRMETGLCHSPVIETQMETLAGMLENYKGKKVYGYLRKPVKNTTEYPNCAMVWTVKPVPLTVLFRETPICSRTGNTVISKEVLEVLGMARHGPMER